MSIALIVFLGLIVLLFICKMPICYSFLAAGVAYFIISGRDITAIITNVASEVLLSYVIIAIPLFLFSANVMNAGKITDKLFSFANGIVGHARGGLGHVNIISSLIFAGMSGSAVADAAGLGEIEIKSMKDNGYESSFAAAITSTSAVVGPIFPPSLPMVAYSLLASTSLIGLFAGGMIPALVVVAVLMAYVAIIAKKRNYPRGAKIVLRDFLLVSFKAIPALLTPVILLAGMYTGIMTPTEAAAIAGLYALIVAGIVYRTLSFKALKDILISTIKGSASIGTLVAMAVLVSYILQIENVSTAFKDLMINISAGSPQLFLLYVNIAFLVFGCLLDVSASMMIFVPLIVPVANALGINLIHLGVVLTLNMMVGTVTPPFGMSLFIVSRISKAPIQAIIKENWGPVIALLVALFLITYIPDIVLWLPRVLNVGF